jgi:AraC-like DNA-binding protein
MYPFSRSWLQGRSLLSQVTGNPLDVLCGIIHTIFSIVQRIVMDPLSAVLALLKPRNYLSAGFEAGGDWAIQFPDHRNGIKTGAVATGQCWLVVEGEGAPVQLFAGDCFLLPRGRAFRLASDLALQPVEAGEVFGGLPKGGVACLNGGGAFSMVSNRFGLTGDYAGFLQRLLPPVVLVRAAQDQGMLETMIQQMLGELRDRRPGADLIIEHLAQMMLVQALRLYLTHGAGGAGWLFALADRQISPALNAVHAEPGQRWTVESLANLCGMSRSSFAARFRVLVGAAPMEYLTRWRMAVAGDRLRASDEPIAVIALTLGYESEAAFSTAFKRVMGSAPRQYARLGVGICVEGESRNHAQRLAA